MTTDDPAIEQIAAGLSENARRELVSLLGELFNVIDNLDVLCANPPPVCSDYMRFLRLRKLLAALGGQHRENPSVPLSNSPNRS